MFYALPLMNQRISDTPPPPDPPAFGVSVGAATTSVSGASGTAAVATAFPSNGTAPYSYSWSYFPEYSSPKTGLAGASGASVNASYSGVAVGETAAMVVQVICTDATGKTASALGTPSIYRAS
jgi:hypothetical protein